MEKYGKLIVAFYFIILVAAFPLSAFWYAILFICITLFVIFLMCYVENIEDNKDKI